VSNVLRIGIRIFLRIHGYGYRVLRKMPRMGRHMQRDIGEFLHPINLVGAADKCTNAPVKLRNYIIRLRYNTNYEEMMKRRSRTIDQPNPCLSSQVHTRTAKKADKETVRRKVV